MIYEVHILMGLPGSGKSYFANHWNYENSRDIFTEYFYIIDLDEYMCKGDTLEDTLIFTFDQKEVLGRVWSNYEPTKRIIFVDGLILTFDNLNKVIETCLKYFNVDKTNDSVVFNIHHWNEDRETCLINDSIRTKFGNREESSSITIKNAPYDNIEHYHRLDTKDINVKYNVIKHNVFKLDDFQYILNEYANEEANMVSETWSNGGTSCDCWGGTYNITPDNPLEFVEFDDILSKICPNISFLQYKQLYNKCTEIVTYSDRDYYGGCETYSYHKCDLKKLWEVMREMELF